MEKQNAIKIFEEEQVRTVWDAEQEKWFFSIIDVIAALTGTDRPRKYWSDLKSRLLKEGSELPAKIGQLKLPAEDGKMRMTDVADTEQLFRPVRLFLFAAFAICTMGSFAQAQETVPFTDLFTIRVDTAGGHPFIDFQPDSLPGSATLNARCTALFHVLDYLFANYAEVQYERDQLEATLPDTLALRNKFNELLLADTAFQTLYMRSIDQTTVAPLSMDSALMIASHFFYLHLSHGTPMAHICVGINKVKQMSESMAHPYHAAFCFMAVWSMDDPMGLLQQAVEPFRAELKEGVSDERMAEMQQAAYHILAKTPELRKALLDTYAQKAEYLNFKLEQ